MDGQYYRAALEIAAHVNAGLTLEEILDRVYQNFRQYIPYNRIGVAFVEDDGASVRTHWAKTDQPNVTLPVGYTAPLASSSLETILATGKPRIINDLEAYYQQRPASESTRLMLEEGIRSSLTCPLKANGVPIGFIFFASTGVGTYAHNHVEIFEQIANQLSVSVEKGRLISQLAAQKQAIERQNEELRRLSALKNIFIGTAAHDLRHPISLIQMAVDVLKLPGYLTDDERDAMLREIDKQSQFMLDLLNELLDISVIESSSFRLNPSAVEVSAFLGEAIQQHGQQAAHKGTQIVLDAVPGGYAWADATRLRQVVDNLVSNAVKFSPPGSLVQVRASCASGWWRFEVQDNGPGFTEEDLRRLFQDFARLSARPTGGEKSTGLGLAITRRVVEAHGGQIGVESSGGATFWFTLPTATL